MKEERALKLKQAPTIQDLEELPPFHSAARQGDVNQLSNLLSIHPDLIDYGDGKGYTALMHAVFAKNFECLQLLLESGSKPEVKDSDGRTALILCAQKGWSAGLKAIIDHGANCETTDSYGRNVLHFCSCILAESCMEILLNHDTNSNIINQQDVEGMTPLHWAAFHNRSSNAQLLLEYGANPTIVDNEQKTPLHWAAQNGCTEACKILVGSHYCKHIINEKTFGSKTALHLAAIGSNLGVIFEITQAFSCNSDTGDAKGRTALHWACAVGNDRCVAGLLRLGVCHSPKDHYGETPHAYARQLGYRECASIVENFNPRRPQDVLIPFESLNDLSDSIEKAASRESSFVDMEKDIFDLISPIDKRECEVARLDQLNQQSHLAAYKMESLTRVLGEVFSRGDSGNEGSDDDNRVDNASFMDNLVIFDEHSLSEDEARCQPQMALTPVENSPRVNLEKRKQFSKVDRHHHKVSRMIHSPYKLAPIRTKKVARQSSNAVNGGNKPSLVITSPASSLGSVRKTSASNVKKQPVETTSATQIQKSNLNEVTKDVSIFFERPLGLRRKSVSLNDGLVQFATKRFDDMPLSRTQSFGHVKTALNKLPSIDVKDGRNLTQRSHLIETEFENEADDEISSNSFMGSKEFEREKRLWKKKKKFSRL